MCELSFCNVVTGPGLRQELRVLFLRIEGSVDSFFQRASIALFASVADIRGFGKFPAYFCLVQRTVRNASAAKTTAKVFWSVAGWTDTGCSTAVTVRTVIERLAMCTGSFKNFMVADFL